MPRQVDVAVGVALAEVVGAHGQRARGLVASEATAGAHVVGRRVDALGELGREFGVAPLDDVQPVGAEALAELDHGIGVSRSHQRVEHESLRGHGSVADHDVFNPPGGRGVHQRLHVPIVVPTQDLAVAQLVHRDEGQQHALARVPLPQLGVFGDDDITVGHDVFEIVFVSGQRFETELQPGDDLFGSERALFRGAHIGVVRVLGEVRAPTASKSRSYRSFQNCVTSSRLRSVSVMVNDSTTSSTADCYAPSGGPGWSGSPHRMRARRSSGAGLEANGSIAELPCRIDVDRHVVDEHRPSRVELEALASRRKISGSGFTTNSSPDTIIPSNEARIGNAARSSPSTSAGMLVNAKRGTPATSSSSRSSGMPSM